MPLENFNTLIGIGTIGVGFLTICLIVLYIVMGRKSIIIRSIIDHALPLGFFIGLSAVIGSLVYSEIYQLPPCLFCWWQRIFLYPQTILFGVALYRHGMKNSLGYDIFHYATPLALVGTIISAYHVFLQQGIIASTGKCLQNGVSCTTIDIQVFGFLTIPMMAFILGIALSLLGILVLTHKKTA
jgi:disulfide bond formation protein DsbB